MRKKRKIRKSVFRIVVIILFAIVVALAYAFIGGNKVESLNADAKKYKNNKCIVFYPKSDKGEAYAKKMCEGEELEVVHDYRLELQGNYLHVIYDNGINYYLNSNFEDIDVPTLNDDSKMIISDYLRYTLKKQGRQNAYDPELLIETYWTNLDYSNISYDYLDDKVICYFDKYDINVEIPMPVVQKALNMDFGYEDIPYQKLRYIDPNRPMVAITYDDGPRYVSTSIILDELIKYDSVATFFVLGTRLSDTNIELLRTGIANGNEYGSHTYSHCNLNLQTNQDIYDEVMYPVNVFKNKLDYEMKLYRPPYGNHNDNVDRIIPYTAVIWNDDSRDWKTKNAEATFKEITSEDRTNDVVLLHDIHDFSAEATKKIIPELLRQGYQLVTISELMDALGIKNASVFFGK